MSLRITVMLFGFCLMVLGDVHTAVSSTTDAMESTDVTSECANSRWRAHNQSCYLYMREKIDFYQANESCETQAANLVSISSDEENQFIRKYVKDINLPVWIGLYRTTNELCSGSGCANWMWLDESEVGYEEWTPFLETSGQCVFMTAQGSWGHSVACSTKYGYVCEHKRIIPTTTSEPTTKIRDIEMTSSSDPAGNVASTTDSSMESNDGINIPLIVGCVIGGLVFSGIMILAVVVLVERHRNSSKTEPTTRDMDGKSSKSDTQKRKKERQSSQRDKLRNDQDRKSQQKGEPMEARDRQPSTQDHYKNHSNDDTPPKWAMGINLGNCHEDLELGSTTSAHGGGFNLEPVYAEPIKKAHRPRSEGVKVQENSLYASR